MSALVRMRLAAYLKAQYVIAPSLVGLGLVGILYGGGVARPEEAYGVSALLLFPVLAWQVKILLDAEPDVQRRLARVTVGSGGREIAAGLTAGAVTAIPTILAGLVLPWLFGGVGLGHQSPAGAAPASLGVALVVGVWAHLLALLGGLGVGAMASRPISRRNGIAVTVLAGGAIATVLLGLKASPIPWVAPPIMAVARFGAGELSLAVAVRLSVWAVVWCGVVLAGYWLLRLRRP
jgi:hypothetical protein